jgi:hypothetical protein
MKNKKLKRTQMSKVNLLIVNLLILVFVFGLNSSHLLAETCPPDCPDTTSTTTGDPDCNSDWKIIWAADDPDPIGPGGSVTLRFWGSKRPYDFVLSGTDFSFDPVLPVTAINNNNTGVVTVYAGNNACGSATISVTDGCGVQGSGSVRSSNGTWITEIPGCVFGGDGGYVYQGGAEYAWFDTTKLEIGKYVQYQTIGLTWPGDFGQNCNRCPGNCETAAAGDPNKQCEPCLEKRNDIPCRYKPSQGWQCTTYWVFYDEWVCNN